MSFAAIRSGEPIHVFNGTDYRYWKDKMMRNIISIDRVAWEVVQQGVDVVDEENLIADDLKRLSLDSQACVFITNHLIYEKYHEVKNVPSAKGVWDYLEKI